MSLSPDKFVIKSSLVLIVDHLHQTNVFCGCFRHQPTPPLADCVKIFWHWRRRLE
jgi:hypothetical protein